MNVKIINKYYACNIFFVKMKTQKIELVEIIFTKNFREIDFMKFFREIIFTKFFREIDFTKKNLPTLANQEFLSYQDVVERQ